MTSSEIIENKKLINGLVDFMSEIVVIDRESVTVDRYLEVDANHEMSIDLISQVAYGTTDAIDLLCKFNGIINPLAIKSGDLIIIPNLASLMGVIKKLNVKSIQLQKTNRSVLDKTVQTGSNAPGKKSNKSKNFSKSKDGILIF